MQDVSGAVVRSTAAAGQSGPGRVSSGEAAAAWILGSPPQSGPPPAVPPHSNIRHNHSESTTVFTANTYQTWCPDLLNTNKVNTGRSILTSSIQISSILFKFNTHKVQYKQSSILLKFNTIKVQYNQSSILQKFNTNKFNTNKFNTLEVQYKHRSILGKFNTTPS